MLETDIKSEIRKGLPKVFHLLGYTLRLFNNPVGEGFVRRKTGSEYYLVWGLFVGSSDLIGWITINGIAVFLAIEVKTLTGRERVLQERFRKMVNRSGGIAFIARSTEEATTKLNEEIKRRKK